jgi:hypothetical protein
MNLITGGDKMNIPKKNRPFSAIIYWIISIAVIVMAFFQAKYSSNISGIFWPVISFFAFGGLILLAQLPLVALVFFKQLRKPVLFVGVIGSFLVNLFSVSFIVSQASRNVEATSTAGAYNVFFLLGLDVLLCLLMVIIQVATGLLHRAD